MARGWVRMKQKQQKEQEKKKKVAYKVRNWSEYNQALINRGSLTVWFDEGIMQKWTDAKQTGKRGHPFEYADVAIECMLTFKAVFRLALRQTQGMMESLVRMLKLALPVPSYSTLSRRRPYLTVVLPRQKEGKELHVVVDATGLKIYGEGEWKVRQHGYTRKRSWRKVHLGIDEASGEIVACEVTAKNEHEKEVLPDLLEQIKEEIAQVSGDGAYDYQTVYDAIKERGAIASIPPRKNARLYDNGQFDSRDANVRRIEEIGRKEWKEEIGYHRRSLAETGVFRLKKVFGGHLSARKMMSQTTEVMIRCRALNQMTALGMPDSYPVLAH